MKNTFNLTAKELDAARILVQACLDNMGGTRPSSLEYDEFTWVDIGDLMKAGYTRHQAAGLFSSLHEKGFLDGEHNPRQCDVYVTTAGWKFMDTIW